MKHNSLGCQTAAQIMVRCGMVVFQHSYFSIVNQILCIFPIKRISIIIKRNMPHLKSSLLINIILFRKQKKNRKKHVGDDSSHLFCMLGNVKI